LARTAYILDFVEFCIVSYIWSFRFRYLHQAVLADLSVC
jgi:hypothetical protein